jgi:hypothetical protein
VTVRPRIQREFLIWLNEAEDRLPCQVTRIARTDLALLLRLDVVSPHIFVALARYGIAVGVEWDGECWDYLYDDMVSPQRITGGYVCSYCEPDCREVYASRAELWRSHLFKPWPSWLVGKLNEVEALVLYGMPGATWGKFGAASLNGKEQDHVVAIIPLQKQNSIAGASSLMSTILGC